MAKVQHYCVGEMGMNELIINFEDLLELDHKTIEILDDTKFWQRAVVIKKCYRKEDLRIVEVGTLVCMITRQNGTALFAIGTKRKIVTRTQISAK